MLPPKLLGGGVTLPGGWFAGGFGCDGGGLLAGGWLTGGWLAGGWFAGGCGAGDDAVDSLPVSVPLPHSLKRTVPPDALTTRHAAPSVTIPTRRFVGPAARP